MYFYWIYARKCIADLYLDTSKYDHKVHFFNLSDAAQALFWFISNCDVFDGGEKCYNRKGINFWSWQQSADLTSFKELFLLH